MKKYLVIMGVLLLVGCSSNYSKGYRVGVVRKFSYKGLFIKSWEGELLLGGVVPSLWDDATLINEIFEFSIDPDRWHDENIDEVVKQVNDAVDSGKRVKLFYNENTIPKIRTETDYMIYKVEVVDNKVRG